MLQRILALFRRRIITVPGADALERGMARTIQIGDALNGGTQILICRNLDGHVFALDTDCPHGEGGRLIPGPLAEGKYAVCPLHNYQFNLKSGQPERGACRPARRFAIREVDGQFQIRI
ncbi:MAG: Rieske 2Fe-2S domain-containing protein [Planctomycetota bacterium]